MLSPLRLNTSVIEAPELEQIGEGQTDKWLVVVYNNEYNTYDEVMAILMIATGCDANEAYIETWEIDHLGQSVVHQASEEECTAAAEIISTIGIRVEVIES